MFIQNSWLTARPEHTAQLRVSLTQFPDTEERKRNSLKICAMTTFLL